MSTPAIGASNALDFFLLCGKLKTIKRTGWVRCDVQLPESISDHMHRMATMAFLCEDPTLDKTRITKIALVHDLAESVVGDITPHCGVSEDDKHAREEAAMRHIRDDLLEGSAVGHEMYDLWMEYEKQETKESNFVKDLDKFEMIVQAFEYEKAQNRPGELAQFFNSTQGKFKHPLVKQWVADLVARRAAFIKECAAKTSTSSA
eukprot:Colp12_sorted_trinity150504_noHs@8867